MVGLVTQGCRESPMKPLREFLSIPLVTVACAVDWLH